MKEPTRTGDAVEPLRVEALRTANGLGNDKARHVLLRLRGEQGWGRWYAIPPSLAESLIESLAASLHGCDREQAMDN